MKLIEWAKSSNLNGEELEKEIMIALAEIINFKLQMPENRASGENTACMKISNKTHDFVFFATRHKRNILKCEDCGKEDDTVREDICPFAWEMSDKVVKIVICQDCYNERGKDI